MAEVVEEENYGVFKVKYRVGSFVGEEWDEVNQDHVVGAGEGYLHPGFPDQNC